MDVTHPVGPFSWDWDKRAFWGPDEPLGALLGPPVDTEKAPEWANMTYYHVLYPSEVFWGHFDPSRALSGTHVNFFQ